MSKKFFEVVAQFASSIDSDDEADAAALYAKLLDKEGKEEFSRELKAISVLDKRE